MAGAAILIAMTSHCVLGMNIQQKTITLTPWKLIDFGTDHLMQAATNARLCSRELMEFSVSLKISLKLQIAWCVLQRRVCMCDSLIVLNHVH